MQPSRLQQVQEVMENILHEVKYAKKLDRPTLAYTYARMNNLCGTIYRIYINNTDPELAKFLYVHECGHIIFSHAKNMNLREDRFLRIKIAAAYDKVKEVFESPESLFEFFRNMIYNLVMDFEVNSKMYTKEEWEYMNRCVQSVLKDPDAGGLWPEDFDFPCGLTWNEYLNLILMRPEIFLERLKTQFDVTADRSDGKPNPEERNGNVPNRQLRFSPEDIERMKKLSADHNNATFSIPDGNRTVFSRKHTGTVGIDFIEFENLDELLRMMKKLLYVSSSSQKKRDQLYNWNRRKFNSNVLVPKDVSQQNHRRAGLYLLFDVSGSVDPKDVFNLISTFKNFEKEFRETRIVTWTTQLVDSWLIEEKIPNNYGGGTDLAPGILYMNSQFKLKADDVLFVISDFADNLYEWKDALNSLHCKKYAVNWNSENGTENPGFNKVLKAGREGALSGE